MDFLLPIIIIVLLLMVLSSINTKFQSLQDLIFRLNDRVNELSKELNQKEKIFK